MWIVKHVVLLLTSNQLFRVQVLDLLSASTVLVSIVHHIIGLIDCLTVDEVLKVRVDIHLGSEELDKVGAVDCLDLLIHIVHGCELDCLDRG